MSSSCGTLSVYRVHLSADNVNSQIPNFSKATPATFVSLLLNGTAFPNGRLGG
jgi:hypothetical protein